MIAARQSGRRRCEMSEKTCAACDCALDDHAIQVTIGGHAVEVCCEECALALGEAQASALRSAGN